MKSAALAFFIDREFRAWRRERAATGTTGSSKPESGSTLRYCRFAAISTCWPAPAANRRCRSVPTACCSGYGHAQNADRVVGGDSATAKAACHERLAILELCGGNTIQSSTDDQSSGAAKTDPLHYQYIDRSGPYRRQ